MNSNIDYLKLMKIFWKVRKMETHRMGLQLDIYIFLNVLSSKSIKLKMYTNTHKTDLTSFSHYALHIGF